MYPRMAVLGIVAAGVQVQTTLSPQLAHLSVAALGLSLISVHRLHATSLGTRTGFFPGQSTFCTGQGTRQRIPGLFRDTWQLCSVMHHTTCNTLHHNTSHCMQHVLFS